MKEIDKKIELQNEDRESGERKRKKETEKEREIKNKEVFGWIRHNTSQSCPLIRPSNSSLVWPASPDRVTAKPMFGD